MLLLEEIADDLWLPLPTMQVTAHTGHHLGAVGRTPGGHPNSPTCGHPKIPHLTGS